MPRVYSFFPQEAAKQFKSHFSKECDPFETYKHFFSQINTLSPWTATQQGNYAFAKTLCHGYWEWAKWQQITWQQAVNNGSRWMMHCMQLSSQPHTLYRYVRMHWQKPYLAYSAQTITGSRLLAGIITDCWTAWHKTLTRQL